VFLLADALSQSCNSTLDVDVDRPGSDYSTFALGSPDATLCRDACCKDLRCAAWTYVKPGIQGPNPICYLKTPIPNSNPNACCSSGFVLADNSKPLYFSQQFHLQAIGADSVKGDVYTDDYFYDYANKKLVLYRYFNDGSVVMYLDRYDLGQNIKVSEYFDNKTGDLIHTCDKANIKDFTIFPPDILQALANVGSGIIDGQSCTEYAGNVTAIGPSVWYQNFAQERANIAPVRTLNSYGLIVPFAIKLMNNSDYNNGINATMAYSYQFEVKIYQPYVENPSVFDEPISLC